VQEIIHGARFPATQFKNSIQHIENQIYKKLEFL